MSESINHYIFAEADNAKEHLFPHAPLHWTSADAEKLAVEEGISMLEEIHWRTIICLQDYYAKHDIINIRQLHDALNEKFHFDGGMKALYNAFPKGPVAQGCRLAGLRAPAAATNQSMGSFQ